MVAAEPLTDRVGVSACVRIGAIHSVVFGGFSSDALRDRILDCKSKLLITADGYWRSGKQIKSKDGADSAVAVCPTIKNCIIVKRLGIKDKFVEHATQKELRRMYGIDEEGIMEAARSVMEP